MPFLFSRSLTLCLSHSPVSYSVSLAYSLSTHAVFTFALRHFRFRCNGDVAIAPSQLPQGVASIKRKPSTVILRLLRIATPERWLMQRWMVCRTHCLLQLPLPQPLLQLLLLLLLSLLVCPINPIISCKAMRCSWLDFPVHHDIS